MSPETMAMISAASVGLLVGSFLNVCIVRWPEDESVVKPRSKCPQCGHLVAWYDNIPVVSWLILRGKCRHCGHAISVMYPLVELAVAILWTAAIWRYGLTLTAIQAIVFGTILVGITMTDARKYLIPDEFSLGGLGLGLLLSVFGGVEMLIQAVIGAAFGFALLFVVAFLGKKALGQDAMGGGDIKMMAMVGAFVGWKGVLLTIFGGALLGTLVFLPLRLAGKNLLVPFGIFLAIAAGITFVAGDDIISWYVRGFS